MNDEALAVEPVEEVTEAVEVEETEAVETVEQEPVKPNYSEEDAAEAKAFGWKSPDEWQGEVPSGYIDDPRRYLERAENFRPFKALKEKMEERDRDAAERLRKLEAMSDQALQMQRSQFQREMQSIQAQKREAVENADVEAFDALSEREKSLRPPSAPAPGPDPEMERVANEYANSEVGAWVRNPILKSAGAELINAALVSGRVFPTAQDQINYAETEIRKMYPSYFPAAEKDAPKPPTTQRVDSGGLAGGVAKGGAFTKLPAEAKGAFKKFVGEGLFKDTEEDRKRYADDYNAA